MLPDETTDANPEGAASTAPEKQPKVFGEDYVRQLREESKARRLEIERLESQLNELKATAQGGPDDDVKKTLNELKAQLKAEQKAREEAAAKAAAAERQALRLKVAADLGLPPALAGRLQGETEDELRADAETLKPLVTPAEQSTQKPKQTTTPVPGGQPSGETADQRRARLYGRGPSGGGPFG